MNHPTTLTNNTSSSGGGRARYAFSNSSDQAPDQLGALEQFLDPVTTTILDQLPVRRHDRWLEIGPGGGSITRWLADKVGPLGDVVAVDLDPTHLTPTRTIDIHQADIRDGLPDPGPFNGIHARLVLVHLPERRHVLRMLADALIPGGWLIVGEFGHHPPIIYTSPTDSDRHLYTRVLQSMQTVLEDHGVDVGWADTVHTTMHEAGLHNIHTVEHAESWAGGSTGTRLHHSNTLQKQDQLLAHGLTPDDLDRFRHLMTNPDFAARSYRYVCTRGQRPPTQPTQPTQPT